MQNHTLTGFGYGMFWRNPYAVDLIHAGFESNTFFANMRSGAHNVIMELWLNVGLLGIGAYFFMLLRCMRNVKYLGKYEYMFCSSYMLVFFMHGLTERAFATYDYLTMFMFMACGIGASAVVPQEEMLLENSFAPPESP